MILMLVLFRRFAFDMVGFNTVLATIVNAPLIGIFGKILDRAGSFDSSFPQFYEKFQSILNPKELPHIGGSSAYKAVEEKF